MSHLRGVPNLTCSACGDILEKSAIDDVCYVCNTVADMMKDLSVYVDPDDFSTYGIYQN